MKFQKCKGIFYDIYEEFKYVTKRNPEALTYTETVTSIDYDRGVAKEYPS